MYPFINLGPNFSIPVYFLVISIATVLSALWFIRRAEARSLSRLTAIDLTLVILISGFLGARLLHIVFEELPYYRENPFQVFSVWNGGFVFLGGVFAAFFFTNLFCQWRREPFWYWADVAVLPISLGYILGRVACFLNGCCFGKVCELPWAVFTAGAHRHPTQLYAVAWESIVLALLFVLEKRLKASGLLFNVWLILHGIGRFVMEIFRDDPRGELILGASLGMWMCLILISFAIYNLTHYKLSKI